jgi:hypothetical protein
MHYDINYGWVPDGQTGNLGGDEMADWLPAGSPTTAAPAWMSPTDAAALRGSEQQINGQWYIPSSAQNYITNKYNIGEKPDWTDKFVNLAALGVFGAPFLAAGLGGAAAGGAEAAAPSAITAPAAGGGVGDLFGGGFNFLDPSTYYGAADTTAGLGSFTPGLGEGVSSGSFLDPALNSAYYGAPYQAGYNYLDPSTYGATPGASSWANTLRQIQQFLPKTPGGTMQGGPGGGASNYGNTGLLGGLAGVGTGLYDLFSRGNQVDPAKLNYLWQAGVDTYNQARDPQQALYDRTAGQVQDQTRAAQSARGLAMSPYAAGGEADTMGNFNINWQNNLLQRQIAGLGGLSEASGGYFGQTNQNQKNQQAQLQSGTNALLTGATGLGNYFGTPSVDPNAAYGFYPPAAPNSSAPVNYYGGVGGY